MKAQRPPTMAEQLAELARLVGGQDPGPRDHFVAVQHGAAYLEGSVTRVPQPRMVRLPSGLLVPEGAARRPAPIDQMKAYLVAEEVFGTPLSLELVRHALHKVCLEHAVSWSATWLSTLRRPDLNHGQVDAEFARRYFAEPYRTRTVNLLRDPQRVLLTPQALTLLMKLAFRECTPQGAPGNTSGNTPIDTAGPPRGGTRGSTATAAAEGWDEAPLVLALVGLAEHLGAHLETDPEVEWVVTETPGELGRDVIANHIFNASPNLKGRWAMFQRCWRELPAELGEVTREQSADLGPGVPASAARLPGGGRDLDLAALYREVVGVTLDDVVTVCGVLWAAGLSGRPAVDRSYFSALGWDERRLEGALRLVAATPEQMVQMLADEVETLGWEWSVRTFAQFPVVAWPSGHLTVLDSDLMVARASGLWPMYDILRELETAGDRGRVGEVRRVFGELVERYATEAIVGIVGGAGSGRFYGEQRLKEAFRNRAGSRKCADAALEYEDAWVVFEVTTTGLSLATLGGTDDDAVVRDMDTFIRKVRQLDATIGHLRAGEHLLTGGAPKSRTVGRRFFPVLVVADRFAHDPIFMTLLRERVAAAGLLCGADVALLEVMEIDDLDAVEGLAEEGGPSLLKVLQGKRTSPLLNSSVRDYILLDLRRSPAPPERVQLRWRAWMDTAAAALRGAA